MTRTVVAGPRLTGVVDWRRRLRDADDVIGLGVQTWSTDVAAVERSARRRRARLRADHVRRRPVGLHPRRLDDAGCARAGDRHARIGPASPTVRPRRSSPSWLAERAVTVDHLSAVVWISAWRSARVIRDACGVGASRHPLSRRSCAGRGARGRGRGARPSAAWRDREHQRPSAAARRVPGATPIQQPRPPCGSRRCGRRPWR